MAKQNSFIPSRFEVFQKENPDRFARGQKGAMARKYRRSQSSKSKPSAPKVYNCETCGLWGKTSGCLTTQIKRYGLGEKRIMFVGLCPGREEERLGVPFVGPSGQLLRKHCQMLGLDLDRDCVRTNAVGCYPGQTAYGADKIPTPDQVKSCQKNLQKDIAEVQPDLIICLGDHAINAVLDKPQGCNFQGQFSASMMHGIVVPSHKHNCWVACAHHPAFFLQRKHRDDVPYDENIFLFDIAGALGYLGQPLPTPLTKDGNIMLTNVDDIVTLLEEWAVSDRPTAFDYETFRLTPYEEGADILTFSLSQDPEIGYFVPLNVVNPATGKDFFTTEEMSRICCALRGFLGGPVPKVVQNLNMEEVWGIEFLRQPMENFHHDTMIAAHVLHCNSSTTSLAFQVFEMTGHDYKEMVDCRDLRKAPIDSLFHYNSWDSRYTIMAYYYQRPRLEKEGRLAEFNELLQRGALALARLRQRGVSISMSVLSEIEDQYRAEQEVRIKEMETSIGVQNYLTGKNEGVTNPEKHAVFNPESNPQLSRIIYKGWGAPVVKRTPTSARTGIGSVDVEGLELVQKKTDDPALRRFISSLFRYRKCGTLLKRSANYRKVMDSNSHVHPCYNLNIADTYRSSANGPNIQNVFKHDSELKAFRRCITPSPGRIILEVDYSGLEVRVIAMASRDVELTRQIRDGVDTHRRWAAEIYQKVEEDITKDERFESKNGFIFASFYGAVPESIARKFPTVPDGHIARIQEKFWGEFQGVKAWQQQTIDTYVNCGYVEAMSGFRRYGPLTINKLYNTPIQGPAFHLLLDALVRIEIELERRGLQSRPIFEIHDSIAIDTVPSEAEEVVDLVTAIMCSKRFDWQGDVPLNVEWECGVDHWFGLANLAFEVCTSCGVSGPHSVLEQKRKGPEEREVKFQVHHCGTCRQKREVVLSA